MSCSFLTFCSFELSANSTKVFQYMHCYLFSLWAPQEVWLNGCSPEQGEKLKVLTQSSRDINKRQIGIHLEKFWNRFCPFAVNKGLAKCLSLSWKWVRNWSDVWRPKVHFKCSLKWPVCLSFVRHYIWSAMGEFLISRSTDVGKVSLSNKLFMFESWGKVQLLIT